MAIPPGTHAPAAGVGADEPSLVDGLDPPALARVMCGAVSRKSDDGELLFAEGESPHRVLIVQSVILELRHCSPRDWE